MKILYLHQYFKTPDEPGGTRSYWIAKELIKNGYQVTMITSSLKFSEEIRKIYIDGIEVIYIRVDYEQSMNPMKRVNAFLKFMFRSLIIAIKQKNVDLVIATSTPLTIGIPALILKWFKNIPFIFEVRDLWPEAPIQLGIIKNRWLILAAHFLEKTIYKNASHVIALSPGMQEGVLKYLNKEKVTMIPNMAKIDIFWPREKNYEKALELDLKKD
jgi:glycosyltransferase involved in cell wall biosynthesis